MILNVEFKATEPDKQEMQEIYNELAELNYPTVLQWGHYDVYKQCASSGIKDFSVYQWREFLSEPRVAAQISREREDIALRAQSKLLNDIAKGTKLGTAEMQALSQVTQINKRNENNRTDDTKYIYTFVPLDEFERQAPSVKLLKAIPDEIRSAIQVYEDDKSSTNGE